MRTSENDGCGSKCDTAFMAASTRHGSKVHKHGAFNMSALQESYLEKSVLVDSPYLGARTFQEGHGSLFELPGSIPSHKALSSAHEILLGGSWGLATTYWVQPNHSNVPKA